MDRPATDEPDELERHNKALQQAPPDFAREHMAEVAFDRVQLDGFIAIFYRIAGESLPSLLLPPGSPLEFSSQEPGCGRPESSSQESECGRPESSSQKSGVRMQKARIQ